MPIASLKIYRDNYAIAETERNEGLVKERKLCR